MKWFVVTILLVVVVITSGLESRRRRGKTRPRLVSPRGSSGQGRCERVEGVGEQGTERTRHSGRTPRSMDRPGGRKFCAGFVPVLRSGSVGTTWRLHIANTKLLAAASAGHIEESKSTIIGGVPAAIGEFPYQVLVKIYLNPSLNGYDYGGGVIVTPKYALTAGHIFKQFPYMVQVIAGITNIDDHSPSRQEISVQSITVHENYYQSTFSIENDIALLRLEKNLTLNLLVQPAHLMGSGGVIPNQCTVVGWGSLQENIPISVDLMKIDVTIFSYQYCQNFINIAHKICTWDPSTQTPTNGDSGGPLICNGFVAGIASFNKPFPTHVLNAFTQVPSFFNWILYHIAN